MAENEDFMENEYHNERPSDDSTDDDNEDNTEEVEDTDVQEEINESVGLHYLPAKLLDDPDDCYWCQKLNYNNVVFTLTACQLCASG